MNKLISISSTACTLLLLSGAASYAQNTGITEAIPQAISMGGETKYDGWYNLSAASKTKTVHGTEHTFAGNTGYPGFMNATNAWPSGISSQLYSGESSTAELVKTANGAAGGPFPSGDSLYYGSFGAVVNTDGGTVAVVDSSPLDDVNTLAFQVQIGEAWTYDYYDDPENGLQSPILTLSYGVSETITIAPTITELVMAVYSSTVEMPSGDEDVYINLYAYQWDVSDYDDISEISISFTAVEHAQLYALQLDQSSIDYGTTSMLPAAVPEPSTWALTAGAGVLAFSLLLRRRRRHLSVD